MDLVCCLNGVRTPAEYASLPVTPAEIAGAARAAVAAGATSVHAHPKTAEGRDTLDAEYVDATVEALRAAITAPVGVTTGAWTGGDRVAQVARWSHRPDYASVNWHEDGAPELATALLARGIAVEAGCWTLEAVLAWRQWARRADCLQVLLEPRTVAEVADMVDAAGHEVPVLLHSFDEVAWTVLREAQRRGLRTRIGLEDSLVLPDGSAAPDNACLIRAALRPTG